MAWKRVRHPSEVVNVGDELEVRVLKFDRERNRVSLGLKQLGEDPWENISRRYPANSRVFGKVSNVTDYGAFVEIEPGVEGLVHVSEMDWTNKNVNPSKVVQVGDEVEVMVLDVDEERRRISLGMKQVAANPWETFAAIHKKGDKVTGQIKSITDFGIFIGLEGGIDGLVHLSDISWNTTGEDVLRNFKKGDTLDAVVLAVDPERERISLGLKQMEQDPFGQYMAAHPKGSKVEGVVKEVDAKGAVVELADGIEGYVAARDIANERVDDATQYLKVGDKVEAKFVGMDRKGRTLWAGTTWIRGHCTGRWAWRPAGPTWTWRTRRPWSAAPSTPPSSSATGRKGCGCWSTAPTPPPNCGWRPPARWPRRSPPSPRCARR